MTFAALTTRTKLLIFVVGLVLAVIGTMSYLSVRLDETFLERDVNISTQAAFDAFGALQADALYDGNLTEVRKTLHYLRANPNIQIAIVTDDAGRILSDGTEENAQFFKPIETNLLERLRNDPSLRDATQRNGLSFEAMTRIAIPDGPHLGYFYLRASLEPHIDHQNERLAWTIRVAAVMLTLASAAAIAFAMWLTRPILGAARVAQQIADGELSSRVDVRGKDEIGLLGSVMNDMAESLGTKIQALEEARTGLRMAKDQAEAANRAKTEFLATMTHELRTPLNAIIGFSDVLMADIAKLKGGEAAASYVDTIKGCGEQLLKLINDILDISRIEMGKLVLQEETTSITSLVETTMKMLRTRASEGSIAMSSAIAKNLPPIFCDRRKMLQVLTNVTGNAIKFTPAGGKVDIRAFLDAAGRPVIEIADTGIGIAQDDIEKALAPFGQVDGAMTRRYDGVGLGLPLSKALIEAQSGQFAITSEPGQGTIVTITLPKTRAVLARA
ncbi:MAG: HAMP domain-containing sensor histidine kinase [Alphaproteobacteria bacterium]